MPSTAASNWHCSTPITTRYCFQPIHIFDAATAKPVLSLLRPGNRPSGDEAARVLRHVIGRIRRIGPGSMIAVRVRRPLRHARGHGPAGGEGHGYILGLPGNARLSEIGPAVVRGRGAAPGAIRQGKVRRFFQTGYQAKSWSRERKVVARVEATAKAGRMSASSSPTCRAAPNRSTRGSIANPWPDGKHDQGAQALHQIRPNLRVPMGSQPVPAVPAGHRRLLAAASVAPDRAPPLAVAHRDVRDATTGIPQDRRDIEELNTPQRSPGPRPTHIATP